MNKEQEETIARKITGCNTFKNCSYEVFCHGLDLAFQLGQIQGQKEENMGKQDLMLGVKKMKVGEYMVFLVTV